MGYTTCQGCGYVNKEPRMTIDNLNIDSHGGFYTIEAGGLICSGVWLEVDEIVEGKLLELRLTDASMHTTAVATVYEYTDEQLEWLKRFSKDMSQSGLKGD
jgi:hypothetical protein